MTSTPIKIASIISLTAIFIAIIVMYPTYRCMLIAADGSGGEIICVIKQN